MLLSRTAHDLYWLGRHLERAEGLARVAREQTNLMVDLPIDVESDWSTLLAITGTTDTYALRYDGVSEAEIMTFLLADIGNPTSLVRTVSAARENLRVSRQLVPRSAWETLNRLHLLVVDRTANCTTRSARQELMDRVVASCQQLCGILDGAMTRDHAWRICQLGRQLERADLTTRVLDVRAGGLMASGSTPAQPPADRSPYEDVQWLGVLRCLAAQHMFQRATTNGVDGPAVVNFLLDDPQCPRSVEHCIDQMERLLVELPTRPTLLGACQGLRSVLRHRRSGDVSARQLREHVDRVQLALASLHHVIDAGYFSVGNHPSRAAARST